MGGADVTGSSLMGGADATGSDSIRETGSGLGPEAGSMGGTDAKRLNEGKVPMHLLPLWLFEELAIHYGEGAKKYEPWNWIKGGSTDTCFGALLRHLTKWQAGEDIDPETQTHHMCAVAWNALTLLHGYKMGIDRDDRPKLPVKSPAGTITEDKVTTSTFFRLDPAKEESSLTLPKEEYPPLTEGERNAHGY